MASFGKITIPSGFSRGGGSGGPAILQIVQIPAKLAQSPGAVQLEGEVTQMNKQDSTARIETPSGTITVKAKGAGLKEGQRVAVELPPGNPPRQAKISPQTSASARDAPPQGNPPPARPSVETNRQSPAPSQPAPASSPQSSSGDAAARSQTQAAPPRTDLPRSMPVLSTRAAEQILTAVAAQAAPRPVTLTPELPVRLIGLPPVQAQAVITNFLESLPPPLAVRVEAAAYRANVSPALLDLSSTLNNTAGRAPALSATTPAPLGSAAPVQTSLLNTSFLTPALPTASAAMISPAPGATAASILSLPGQGAMIPPALTLPPAQGAALLQGATLAPASGSLPPPPAPMPTLPAQPVLFTQSTPSLSSSQPLAKLDGNILTILPSPPSLSPPTAPPQQSMPPAHLATFPAATAPFPTTFSGQVTAFTAEGLPILSVQVPGRAMPQAFVLQARATNLPLGGQVTIAPHGTAPTVTAAPAPMSNPLLRGFQWPAVDELMLTLSQISPQAAASFSRALPSAGNTAQLGAAAMVFAAAIRTGDMGVLLGERKLDLIRQAGRENLLSRLVQGDGARAAGPEPVSGGGDWRAVPLPMFWEGEIHRITLYTRHENFAQKDKDEKGEGQTRFVFDLSLSRMGEVQLDGFLKDRRLDLVIRSEQSFSPAMQQTMRQAYTGALSHTDMAGELHFQGNLQHWVHVLEKQEQLGVDV
jgi:hypothetical protein